MPRLNLPEGRVLHYSDQYVNTHIAGCVIPDASSWCLHPVFLASQWAVADADPNKSRIETWGDLKTWLLENWVAMRRSDYANFMSYTIEEYFGVRPDRHTRTEAEGYVRYGYDAMGHDVPIFGNLTLDHGGRPHPTSMILYTPEEPSSVVPMSLVYRGWTGDRIIGAPYDPGDTPSKVQRSWTQLNNYSFKMPDAPFLGLPTEKHSQYFGLELELSTSLTPMEFDSIVTKVEPVQERFFYFKSDSSVTGSHDNNMELVTVPMTPKRMKKEFKVLFKKLEGLIEAADTVNTWTDIFDMRRDLNNGIHIHVSREAFEYKEHVSDSRHARRFLTVFNQWDRANLRFLNQLAKRPTESLNDNEYCAVHPAMEGRTLARRLANGLNGEHVHRSATTETSQTIEVRIFQGFPVLGHILECIELVECVFDYSLYAPNSKFGPYFQAYFTDWVEKQPGFNHAKELVRACALS